MDDFGGYSLWGDTPDYGTSFDFGGSGGGFNFNVDTPSYDFGGGFSPSLDTSWLNSYINPAPSQPMFQQGPLGVPSLQQSAPVSGGGANPWIAGALGAIGPLTGLIGALASGGQGPTSGPKPTTAQQANINRGTQLTEMGALGSLPAQQMQMSLLQALASGQGLPAGYSQLVEQAFEPQMGSLFEQATRAGRARGFHDAPAQSPAGGAILGPGLSNLQGQMAAAKLGLMQSLPGLFNAPSQTQAQLANAFAGNANNPSMMQQTTQTPMGPTIANAIGNIFSGAAQGYAGATSQNQQSQALDSILKALQQQQPGGMSYTPRY